MEISIDVAVEAGAWPGEAELTRLAEEAVGAATAQLGLRRHPRASEARLADPEQLLGRAGASRREARELSILFTDDAHIRRLNAHYRNKDKPTNVLSFPPAPGPAGNHILGDIVLAFETVRDEAALAEKPLEAHMAHLVIHGFLHLLGYDHEGEAEAEEMEALERAALKRLGIPDPYPAARET